jgi:hypothetical protein
MTRAIGRAIRSPATRPIASRALRLACYGLAMRRTPASLLPVTLVLALTACAAAKDYPSLERLPSERMTGSATPVTPDTPPPPPPAPPSGSLTNRLAQLADQARAADRRFSERRGSAERLIAGGSGRTPGSEGWSVATVALADLASSRSDAMMALAELDRIYVDESIAAAETGDRSSIDAITVVRDQVTALISAQDETLARLHSRISG